MHTKTAFIFIDLQAQNKYAEKMTTRRDNTKIEYTTFLYGKMLAILLSKHHMNLWKCD